MGGRFGAKSGHALRCMPPSVSSKMEGPDSGKTCRPVDRNPAHGTPPKLGRTVEDLQATREIVHKRETEVSSWRLSPVNSFRNSARTNRSATVLSVFPCIPYNKRLVL